jgi:hypothetical protein
VEADGGYASSTWRRRVRRAQVAVAAAVVVLIPTLAQQPVQSAFNGSTGSAGNQVTTATTFCTTPGSATVNASADSTVNQAAPNAVAGGDDYMIVASLGPANNHRTFVRFGLPVIPAGCTVTAATLRLFTDGADAGRTLGVYRADPVPPLWTEAGLNWNNQPATAGTPATAVTVATIGYLSWTVTALVPSLYSGANNGFVVKDQTEGGSGPWQQYFARHKANPPKLDVSWG